MAIHSVSSDAEILAAMGSATLAFGDIIEIADGSYFTNLTGTGNPAASVRRTNNVNGNLVSDGYVIIRPAAGASVTFTALKIDGGGGAGKYGFKFEGIHWDIRDSGANSPVNQYTIQLSNNPTDLWFYQNTGQYVRGKVLGGDRPAVWLDGSKGGDADRLRVTGCVIRGCYHAVHARGQDIIIEDNEFYECTNDVGKFDGQKQNFTLRYNKASDKIEQHDSYNVLGVTLGNPTVVQISNAERTIDPPNSVANGSANRQIGITGVAGATWLNGLWPEAAILASDATSITLDFDSTALNGSVTGGIAVQPKTGHNDFFQFRLNSGFGVQGWHDGMRIYGNRLWRGVGIFGCSDGQGFFFGGNDGIIYNDLRIVGNFLLLGLANGITVVDVVDGIIATNTVLMHHANGKAYANGGNVITGAKILIAGNSSNTRLWDNISNSDDRVEWTDAQNNITITEGDDSAHSAMFVDPLMALSSNATYNPLTAFALKTGGPAEILGPDPGHVGWDYFSKNYVGTRTISGIPLGTPGSGGGGGDTPPPAVNIPTPSVTMAFTVG